MDFQKMQLDIEKALTEDEVKSLVFLCTDLLNGNTSSVESAKDLFWRLMDKDCLSSERPQLLRELLLIIQRSRLVRELGFPDHVHTDENLISPYRKLLYDLSEQITEENLKEIKFLLYDKLPRNKLENMTTLEIFLQMEKMDLLSQTNLNEVEKIIEAVCPMLKRKIQRFKDLQVPQINVIAQEEGRPRSMTDPADPQMLLNPAPSLAATSCTSLDFLKDRDQCESLTSGMSLLLTETVDSTDQKAGNDASQKFPVHKNKTSPVQKSHAANSDTEFVRKYPMNSAKRGVCLIVNNHKFTESNHGVRNGTMHDEESLKTVFQWLGFDIQIHKDCSSRQILSVVRELSKKDHSQMDCLVCCVLSHGVEGSVLGVDGGHVEIKKLMDPFDGSRCHTLVDKPKIFFIQACQGTEEQKAVYVESEPCDFRSLESDAVKTSESIPAGADFLLGMSTVPNFASFREKSSGSWFIQSLCKNLARMVPRGYDLLDIMMKVNADVSKKSDHSGRRKQMPQPAFSLRKKVIFPVPTAPPPPNLVD
ncbi:unnamed protein product [Ophioblennius macclurei]